MLLYLLLTVTVLAVALVIKSEYCRPEYRDVYSGISRGQLKNATGLFALFVLLVGVSALRLNVGNDYSNYVEFMHRAYSRAVVPTEPGFNYLTILIYKLSGFDNYVAVFAIFAVATVFFFLAAIYRQSEDFYISFMMFILLGYYFQSISTVRYYLALSMALFSVRYCLKGDWPRFILMVLIGALFHKSMLVILVIYPLAAMKWRRWMLGLLGIMCISCLFLKDFYLKIAVMLYPSYEGTEYLSGGTSYVNIVRCMAVLGLAVYILRKEIVSTKELNFYFYCNLFSLLLYIFGAFLPTVSRIAYYMTATHILYVPMLINRSNDSGKGRLFSEKQIFKAATVFVCLVYFAMYMRHAGDDGVRILPYETFLFHELPATLSERGFG